MPHGREPEEIVPLGPRDWPAVAQAVFTPAFGSSDRFARFFPDDGRRRDRIAAAMAHLGLALRMWEVPGLAALHGGAPVGAIAVLAPRPPLPGVVRVSLRVLGLYRAWRIGWRARCAFKAYNRVGRRLYGRPPFHYVMAIGVLAPERDRGIGTRLLDAAFDPCREHPTSRGLLLHTFDPRFAGSLARRGWRVTRPVTSGPVTVQRCFRPVSRPDR